MKIVGIVAEYNPFDVSGEGLGRDWATSQKGFGLERLKVNSLFESRNSRVHK